MTTTFILKDYDNGLRDISTEDGAIIADIGYDGSNHLVEMIRLFVGNSTQRKLIDCYEWLCGAYDKWFCSVHKGVSHRKYVVVDKDGNVAYEQQFGEQSIESVILERVQPQTGILFPHVTMVELPKAAESTVVVPKDIVLDGIEVVEVPMDMRITRAMGKILEEMRKYGFDPRQSNRGIGQYNDILVNEGYIEYVDRDKGVLLDDGERIYNGFNITDKGAANGFGFFVYPNSKFGVTKMYRAENGLALQAINEAFSKHGFNTWNGKRYLLL